MAGRELDAVAGGLGTDGSVEFSPSDFAPAPGGAAARAAVPAGRRPPPVGDAPAVNPELLAAVRTLPPRHRVAMVLRYVADLSEPQIGEVMGVSRGAVAASLSAGRKRLAAILNDAELRTVKEAEHG